MRIIAADDEELALESLTTAIRAVKPEAELVAFFRPEEVLAYASEYECDVAFLDIEMGTMSGIEVAKKLKIQKPDMNIVFVTGYNQYITKAVHMKVSGYVLKPVTSEEIEEEFKYMEFPREPQTQENNKIFVKCFGNFNVFVNGKELDFEKKKTKEMLAYLIDHQGESVTSGELRGVLWESAATDANTRSYLSKLKVDLEQTLREAGIHEKILRTSWGKYSVDVDKVGCDYYDYLENKVGGVLRFNGEYMEQYGWAEKRKAYLNGKADQSNRGKNR